MDHYRPGDKIFLFGRLHQIVVNLPYNFWTGFSRGAYQVRTLAGMIHTVGIVFTV